MRSVTILLLLLSLQGEADSRHQSTATIETCRAIVVAVSYRIHQISEFVIKPFQSGRLASLYNHVKNQQTSRRDFLRAQTLYNKRMQEFKIPAQMGGVFEEDVQFTAHNVNRIIASGNHYHLFVTLHRLMGSRIENPGNYNIQTMGPIPLPISDGKILPSMLLDPDINWEAYLKNIMDNQMQSRTKNGSQNSASVWVDTTGRSTQIPASTDLSLFSFTELLVMHRVEYQEGKDSKAKSFSRKISTDEMLRYERLWNMISNYISQAPNDSAPLPPLHEIANDVINGSKKNSSPQLNP